MLFLAKEAVVVSGFWFKIGSDWICPGGLYVWENTDGIWLMTIVFFFFFFDDYLTIVCLLD